MAATSDLSSLPVVLLAAGSGGIVELQGHIDASSVQWALLQFCVGEGTLKRQRLLFLHINGKDCPPIARGRANELTASVQQMLRQGDRQEAFHASVEVKGPEEVTLENLLERVLPFFVVDKEEYSVQWLQSHYDQQLQEAAVATALEDDAPVAAAAETAPIRGAEAKRGTIFEMGTTTFRNGRDALKAVAEPMGAWNWVFLSCGAMGDDPAVVAGGMGSVEEMQRCYEDHPQDVLFGLLRIGFGEGRLRRTKYVFIHAKGKEVQGVKLGRLSALRPKMEELIGGFASVSVTMELFTPSDLTLQSVVDRVRRAVVVDDHVLDRDKATPSVFSMEAFQQALQEEKKARMDEIRAQRQLRMEKTARDTMESGGSRWAERSISSTVALLRNSAAGLNWLLLGPDQIWLQQRGTSAKKDSLLPGVPTAPSVLGSPGSPSTVAPDSPQSPEMVPDSPEKEEDAAQNAQEESPPATPRPNISFEMMGSQVRLSGPLLKRSGAWHGFWQLRWFQIRGGTLLWWGSPSLVAQEPAGALHLREMKVQRRGATQFALECAFGKKKIYVLDTDVVSSAWEAGWCSDLGGAWPPVEAWLQALQEESVCHPGMSVQGDALAVAGKDLLRSLFA